MKALKCSILGKTIGGQGGIVSAENNPDLIKSLELAITEQHRDFDEVSSLNDATKSKNYVLLGSTLTLLTYLYTFNTPSPNSSISELDRIKERLFIPDQIYGIFLYAVAVVLLIYGLRGLIRALKGRPWRTAYDNDQDNSKMEDYLEYLKCTQQAYLKCSKINIKSYNERRILVDDSFWPIIVGAILLLVLKALGG